MSRLQKKTLITVRIAAVQTGEGCIHYSAVDLVYFAIHAVAIFCPNVGQIWHEVVEPITPNLTLTMQQWAWDLMMKLDFQQILFSPCNCRSGGLQSSVIGILLKYLQLLNMMQPSRFCVFLKYVRTVVGVAQ